LGVYSPSQGFLGNKNVEYYHIDNPQTKYNISTITNSFTSISWELIDQAGLHTIEFVFNSQIISVEVKAIEDTILGSDQVSLDNQFINDRPSLGAENYAQISLIPIGIPLIQFDGSERLTVETSAFINGQNRQLVLGSLEMTSGIFTGSVIYTVEFTTPIWWQPDSMAQIHIKFSGNSLYNSVLEIFELPIRNPGQEITITLPEGVTGGDRSSFGETANTIDINAKLSGDNPNGTILDIFFEMNGTITTYFIQGHELSEFQTLISISIPYDHPLGSGELVALIQKESTIISEDRLPFLIFDELSASLIFSTEILLPNQSIELLAYTYREDTYQPEAAFVTIYEDSTLTNAIFNFETDESGYENLNYTIPESESGNILDWWIEITPFIGSDYNGQLVAWPVSIVGETNIRVNSDVFIGSRGENIVLTAQILADTKIISEGILSLYSVESNTLIHQFNLAQETEADYNIYLDNNFRKGISYYRWDFPGTTLYSPVQKIISLYVYSHPFISEITTNQSYTFPGDNVLIQGNLYLEDNLKSPLDGITSIELWEINASGDFQVASYPTDDVGNFAIQYPISDNIQPGIYSYQIRFTGDESLFLRSAQNQANFELEIRGELGIIWNSSPDIEKIRSGEEVNITVFGKNFRTYEISYATSSQSDVWHVLTQIELGETDQQDIRLDMPETRGSIFLRILELDSGKEQIYNFNLYVDPTIQLTTPKTPIYTFDVNEYFIESSEPFTFLIDGINLDEEEIFYEESFRWNQAFNEVGEHIILIELTSSDLTQYIFEYSIIVYESVIIDLVSQNQAPILEGTLESFTFQITDNHQNPLSNVHSKLVSCITCTNNLFETEMVLTEGYSSNIGELDLESQIIGHQLALLIVGDESRYIRSQLYQLDILIEQLLDADIDTADLQIIEDTSNEVSIRLFYLYSNYTPSDVMFTVKIVDLLDNNQLLHEIQLKTGNNGEAIISLGKGLKRGTYQLQLSSNDPRFGSFEVTRMFQVSPKKH
jgi:hypothetical protein